MNDKYTWEVHIQNSGTGAKGSTTGSYYPTINFKPEDEPTEESMIQDILKRTEEKGFFEDIVEWLKSHAPKRLYKALRDIHRPAINPSYERLCEFVYDMFFKASEKIEQRMILGPNNQWVRKYFKDFPLEQKP